MHKVEIKMLLDEKEYVISRVIEDVVPMEQNDIAHNIAGSVYNTIAYHTGIWDKVKKG